MKAPLNPEFKARIAESFARQPFTNMIGAELLEIEHGAVSVRLPHRADLTQQNGFIHGGVVSSIADIVCGYAGFTVVRPEDSVLTIEFKINLVAPGGGDALIARGEVVRAGKRTMVCQAQVYSVHGDDERLCAIALGTFMVMENVPDTMRAAARSDGA